MLTAYLAYAALSQAAYYLTKSVASQVRTSVTVREAKMGRKIHVHV
jgi:hypothetical protein